MKKLPALFLAVLLLSLTLTSFPVSAQNSEHQIEATNYQFFGTSPTGLIDYIKIDKDGNAIEKKGLVEPNDRDKAVPAAYDLRNVGDKSYVTSVKDQGDYGACWSFASVGALESNLIKQGLATTSIDLSELHTAWYAYTKDPDSGSTTYNDGTNYTGTDKYNVGGWAQSAYALWGSAEGVQLDANAPYLKAADTGFFTETQRKESYYQIKEAFEIPKNNIEAVKNNIMTNGAMYLSFFVNWDCFNSNYSTYYNPIYNSQNSPPGSGGHAVLLVGWDNTYSASNFVINPGQNGAWLCRNSWGTGVGNGGYFWISYKDIGINSLTAFIGSTNDNYDNYNQFERDGFLLPLEAGIGKMSNVFTAQNASTLEAVAFRADVYDGTSGIPGFDYTIKIYTGLPATVTNPTAGSLAATLTGHKNYGGYFTVNLSTPISFNAGQKYSIVLELSCTTTHGSGGRVNFGPETIIIDGYVYWGNNTAAGRSFAYDYSYNKWVDTYGTAELYGIDPDGNFPIKALTNDVDTTYAATRALVQRQLDQTEGCTKGTATTEQWNAFTAARTLCQNIVSDTTASKADLNNAIIRIKVAREKANGEAYATSGDYTFTTSGDVATVTNYTGAATSVKVPKSLNGCSLAIGATVFGGKTALKTVYFTGTPDSIAANAFSGCTNLRFVYFMGNAPAVTGTPGPGSPIGATTYYRSGTTGWTGSPWSGNAEAIIPGDLNGTDGVGVNDAVLFVQRLAMLGSYTPREFAAADINRDGAVNMPDIVLLVQALANPSVILR